MYVDQAYLAGATDIAMDHRSEQHSHDSAFHVRRAPSEDRIVSDLRDELLGGKGGDHVVVAVQVQTAESVRTGLAETIQRLPDHLWQSLTWDQGKEMAEHAQFTIDTGIQIYFCDPRSPWQRGSNENTNGLLRQYFPKTTDMAALTQAELDEAAYSLNLRPRQPSLG